MPTRRHFLRRTGALTAGALLASVRRAAAIDAADGTSFLDAEHVVVLMQENRSFDHMFAAMRGVRGFNDPRALTLPDGKPVWLQTDETGATYAPFRLDIKNTNATWLGSLPHSWRDQTDARGNGNHDRWLEAKKAHRRDIAGMPFTLGFYQRDDLPFYYALADAFTICDQHFCSSLTATTPNRLHLWTGTIREKPDASSPPNVRNADVDYGSSKSWRTFPERLEEAGVSWRIYQNEISAASGLEGESDAWLANFTDNPLEWFEQYRVDSHGLHREHMERLAGSLPDEIAKLRAQGDPEKKLPRLEHLLTYARSERARALATLSDRERSLHEKAFTTNEGDPGYRELATLRYRDGAGEREMTVPKGDPLFRFRKDVAAGLLPAVSWLVPSERFSDHPSSAWYGAWYVAETLNTLTKNPEIWRKTIFVLTYDENDGYFDHVPPFVAPDPGNPESGKTSSDLDAALEYLPLEQDIKRHAAGEARGGPIGLGYRVPLIVASPWSRGGFVCSQVFDHTSVIRLLERVAERRAGREIRETNITAWRRAICGDLTSVFRPFDSNASGVPFPPRNAFFEQIESARFRDAPSGWHKLTSEDWAQPAGANSVPEWMPRQEPGLRPSCALPYEIAADGELSADRKGFDLIFEAKTTRFGDASAGVPFHVYTPGRYRGGTMLRTRAYAVSAGHRLTDTWELEGFENGRYHLRVCGPNGFFREFEGTADDPLLALTCDDAGEGGLRMLAANSGKRALTLRVADESYGRPASAITLTPGQRRSLTFGLAASHGWYDFGLLVDGAAAFRRRFAGRVETGKSGFSDPALNRV